MLITLCSEITSFASSVADLLPTDVPTPQRTDLLALVLSPVENTVGGTYHARMHTLSMAATRHYSSLASGSSTQQKHCLTGVLPLHRRSCQLCPDHFR